jgi:hypothetical protein
MTCPCCRRPLFLGAKVCECGWNENAGAPESYKQANREADMYAAVMSIEQSARTIRNILLWWVILTGIAAAAWFLLRMWA